MANPKKSSSTVDPILEVPQLDVDKMLAELRLEREQLDEAILTLERLARGRGRRRGRPPSWLKDAQNGNGDETNSTPAAEPKKKGRPASPARAKHAAAAEA